MGHSLGEPDIRPIINYSVLCDKFTHNGNIVRVVLRKYKISVGCADVTPEALRQLLKKYDEHFGKQRDEIVL